MATFKGFGALGKTLGLQTDEKKLPPPPKGQASAPYNFVSLPAKMLPAPFELEKNFRDYVQKYGKLSGEILLTIETLTPIFIGGNEPKNFAPVDVPIIPGSSLRGMFKNIFKIVTCGTFRGQQDFNDEHIYFRCLMSTRQMPAWTKDLHDRYEKRMVRTVVDDDGKKRLVKNARPGFLIRRKQDGKYFIAPSKFTSDRKDDYILMKDFQALYGDVKFKDSRIHWVESVAYCLTGNQWANNSQNLLDAAAYKAYKESVKEINDKWKAGLLTDEQHQQAINDISKGKQIVRYTKLEYIDPCRGNWLEVPDEVQRSYRDDRNRGGVDLFKDKKSILQGERRERLIGEDFPEIDTLIPCHFLTDGDKVTAFGHGQCFRIPYEHRIGEAVPKSLQSDEVVDFADAVFGREKHWASRIYFEDATPENFSELKTNAAHALMQPNPTSYQLYLKQGKGVLNDWDADNARIRGYKLYWHNAYRDWHANQSELKLNQERIRKNLEPLIEDITPIDKGSKFKAKIRFKNLSAVELGALMMIFNLNDAKNPAYKIGKGKPFGFGSVRITPRLYVEDDSTYAQLFGADGWQNPYREKNSAEYLDEFKDHLKRRDMMKTWKKVMDELTKILDWTPAELDGWNDYVKQMRGNVSAKDEVDERFKQRAPLPPIKTIFEVVK